MALYAVGTKSDWAELRECRAKPRKLTSRLKVKGCRKRLEMVIYTGGKVIGVMSPRHLVNMLVSMPSQRSGLHPDWNNYYNERQRIFSRIEAGVLQLTPSQAKLVRKELGVIP